MVDRKITLDLLKVFLNILEKRKLFGKLELCYQNGCVTHIKLHPTLKYEDVCREVHKEQNVPSSNKKGLNEESSKQSGESSSQA